MPIIGDRTTGKYLGRPKAKTFIWTACIACKTERWVDQQQIKDSRYLGYCRKCGNYRNGKIQGSKNKKFGRKISSTGYVDILIEKSDPYYSMVTGSGYIKEHRYVMANHLGRCLGRTEIVHHKDGNKKNNLLSNLEIATKYTHEIGFADAYQRGYKEGYATAKTGGTCAY
jgi:hypothetical protein